MCSPSYELGNTEGTRYNSLLFPRKLQVKAKSNAAWETLPVLVALAVVLTMALEWPVKKTMQR